MSWRDFAGRTGVGGAQSLTGDTGTLWFFHGALSNDTIIVTDTVEGDVRTDTNPLGELGSFGDTEAF